MYPGPTCLLPLLCFKTNIPFSQAKVSSHKVCAKKFGVLSSLGARERTNLVSGEVCYPGINYAPWKSGVMTIRVYTLAEWPLRDGIMSCDLINFI